MGPPGVLVGSGVVYDRSYFIYFGKILGLQFGMFGFGWGEVRASMDFSSIQTWAEYGHSDF